MNFEVIFDEKTIEYLNSLSRDVKERIYSKIMSTAINPLHYFERLVGRYEYKLRIGDYRAIADIDRAKRIITILYINHRKNVYKK